MIQEAVENGYDKVAWTTGKQQVKRYSLEKEMDSIVYNKQTGFIQGTNKGDEVIFKQVASDEEVEAMMGKELTKRLIDPKNSTYDDIYVLKGDALKFGGDGMKKFYDEIVPNTAKKLIKKYGSKIKQEELDDIEEIVWSFDVTPKMKEEISKQGQPLYADGGAELTVGFLNGLEYDEDGDLVGFNTEKFIYGFAAAAAVKKAVPFLIDKAVEKEYREQAVKNIPSEVFATLGVEEGKVFADYIQLAKKHPEYFSHPKEVKELTEYVLEKPTFAIPATKKDYTYLIRTNGKDKGTVVEFVKRGGKYRVRSSFPLADTQLETKLNKAREDGEPVFQFRYVDSK